jgi:hypothetical protein
MRIGKMGKILTRYKRKFLVCSDCVFFEPEGVFDERIPELKYGTCRLHDKSVDNRYETICVDNTAEKTCGDCSWYECDFADSEEYDADGYCTKTDMYVDEHDLPCQYFD